VATGLKQNVAVHERSRKSERLNVFGNLGSPVKVVDFDKFYVNGISKAKCLFNFLGALSRRFHCTGVLAMPISRVGKSVKIGNDLPPR